MWKKRQKVPEEGGIRIPDSGSRRFDADSGNGIIVESGRKKARRQFGGTAGVFVLRFAVRAGH